MRGTNENREVGVETLERMETRLGTAIRELYDNKPVQAHEIVNDVREMVRQELRNEE